MIWLLLLDSSPDTLPGGRYSRSSKLCMDAVINYILFDQNLCYNNNEQVERE
jgi:hypothetical protein